MKLFTRATVTGTTLSGATLKSSLTTLWDALKTHGLSDASRTTVTSTSTLATTQCGLLLVDCTSGNITLTLPTSGADTDDAIYNIRRIDSSANTLTVQRGGSDTIEGATAGVTLPAGGIMGLQMPAGGTNWRITNLAASTANTQALTAFTSAGTAPAYTLTPAPAIASLSAGQRFRVKFHSATSSGSSTLAVNGLTATGLKQYDSTGAKVDAIIAASMLADVEYDGTHFVVLDPLPQATAVLRSYLTGMTLSTAGSSTTMSIAAGQAADSGNAVLMNLAATSKTTSAWSVGSGNGGLDTGTIANSTWYYFYAIRRPDTGVVDVVFSTSSSSPTLPTNYTQYRYIGGGLTNGSGQWTKFTQTGDEFWWDSPPLDFSSAGSTTAALLTLSVPRGRKVRPMLSINGGGGGQYTYISDPANADLAPSITTAPLATGSGTATISSAFSGPAVWTNTSAQIRHRENGTSTVYIATLGWTDLRGKDL